MAKYQIKKIVPAAQPENPPTYVDVKVFTEAPAPAQTLYGTILALKNSTGLDHIYELI